MKHEVITPLTEPDGARAGRAGLEPTSRTFPKSLMSSVADISVTWRYWGEITVIVSSKTFMNALRPKWKESQLDLSVESLRTTQSNILIRKRWSC